MESGTTNLEGQCEQSTKPSIIYTAVGWVAGTFRPEGRKFQGVFVTEDGRETEAYLHWYLHHQVKKLLQKQESTLTDWLQSVHRWKVYPRTEPLRFDLMQVKPRDDEAAGKNKQSQPATLDKFRVVGEIRAVIEKKIIVRVRRNPQQPQSRKNSYNAILLTLIGTIPTAEVGQIWELQVRRFGIKLVITKAKMYEPSLKEIELFNWLTLQKNSVDTNKSSAPK